MTTAYATTSVPGWAVTGMRPGLAPPDPCARSWVLVALGAGESAGAAALRAWAGPVIERGAVTVEGGSPDDVRQPLAAALHTARVGVRAAVAGPAGDCLVVRAQLLTAGLEEDEITVIPTGAGCIEIYCAHCQGVTRAQAAIGDVVPCADCGLRLHVYYHVSRTTGRYLGFQDDAELPVEPPSEERPA